MQSLRRWTPVSARSGANPCVLTSSLSGTALRRDQDADRDLAFCAEFAVHGGVARSVEGFGGEADLVRMQQAGLLDLERQSQPPFNIVGVSLSATTRTLLSQSERPTEAGEKSTLEPRAITVDRRQARHGFEVARGLIAAAVKAELAVWVVSGGSGGAAALEAKVMTRIDRVPAPFPT